MHSFTSFVLPALFLGAHTYAAPTNGLELLKRDDVNIRIQLATHKISWGYESNIARTMGKIRSTCTPDHCPSEGDSDFEETLMAIEDMQKRKHTLHVRPTKGSFASEDTNTMGLRHQMVTMALVALEEAAESKKEKWHDSATCVNEHCECKSRGSPGDGRS